MIESSSTWYHVYGLLSKDLHNHVTLSNPVKTKAIASAKVKTDKVDALTLAQLLRGGYIPECYIPSRHIMDLREMVRYRASLVRARTSVKNKIHAILLMKGIKINEEYRPFTIQFVEELTKENRRLQDIRIPECDFFSQRRDKRNLTQNQRRIEGGRIFKAPDDNPWDRILLCPIDLK